MRHLCITRTYKVRRPYWMQGGVYVKPVAHVLLRMGIGSVTGQSGGLGPQREMENLVTTPCGSCAYTHARDWLLGLSCNA